jgi:hypothetical protein
MLGFASTTGVVGRAVVAVAVAPDRHRREFVGRARTISSLAVGGL